jgi:hypothetical protein
MISPRDGIAEGDLSVDVGGICDRSVQNARSQNLIPTYDVCSLNELHRIRARSCLARCVDTQRRTRYEMGLRFSDRRDDGCVFRCFGAINLT